MVKFLNELQAYIDDPANGDVDTVQTDAAALSASAPAQVDGPPAGAASGDGLDLKTGQTEKTDQMACNGMFPGDNICLNTCLAICLEAYVKAHDPICVRLQVRR